MKVYSVGKSKLPKSKKQIGKHKLCLREDGRIECLCEHSIGHTITAPAAYKRAAGKYWDSHGCDGCCLKDEFKKAAQKELRKLHLQIGLLA